METKKNSISKKCCCLSFNVVIIYIFFSIEALSFNFYQQIAYAPAKIKRETETLESNIKHIETGNYLVVGSFSLTKNAISYLHFLKNNSFSPEIGYSTETNRYYVFISQSDNISEVRKERDQIRNKEEFKDAWILTINKDITGKEDYSVIASADVQAESFIRESQAEKSIEKVIDLTGEQSASSFKENNLQELKEYKIFINSYDATNFKEIPGIVKVIYGEQNKLGGIIDTHKTSVIRMPSKGDNTIHLQCEIFGYKKSTHDLVLNNSANNSSSSFIKIMNDTLLIDFELIRYKKGEIFTMYNVFFHNDAAIMLPKSIYDLESLVKMIRENKNMKIKLHGHTNGNSHGKIISMNNEDKDFFNVKPTNNSSMGSAKKLSCERAAVIKDYLIQQGIEESRIETKGWGGKKKIYDTNSGEAKKNVRVEVEILQN